MPDYDVFDIVNKFSSYMNGTTGIVSLVLFILTLIANWRIFEKAGEEGWKSIIPIYNFYIICRILKMNFTHFIIAFIILFIPFIQIGAAIYLLYFYVECDFRLSKAFGHGLGYSWGLVLLNTIFVLLIGLSDDKYDPSRINAK